MGKNQDPGSGINIPDPQHCRQGQLLSELPIDDRGGNGKTLKGSKMIGGGLNFLKTYAPLPLIKGLSNGTIFSQIQNF
jgi:hypothetical protein